MSGSTEALRRKIEGAGDLEGVVRSMKALAASSIGQYENAIRALDDYYRTVELGLAACLRQSQPPPSVGDRSAPPRHGIGVGAVVFGSDQGLVGGFNEALADFVQRTLRTLPGTPRKIWAVGERIHGLLADTGLTQSGEIAVPTSVQTITPLIGGILREIETAREQGDVVQVYLFHNHPKSDAIYEPVRKRLLPLDQVWQREVIATPWPTKILPQIIDGTETTLAAFIQAYLFVLLFQACAESLASENAARLAAMQRAEKNIKDIREDLNRTYHCLRQEGIDEELFDVISGFEALSKKARQARERASK